MGNCQAIDAAALVIQHPCGRIERLYWPIQASEVMRLNPGHYVSLIIPLPPVSDHQEENHKQQDEKTVRFTRVKLLRPSDTLALGHAYRLITSQEVMKVLRAKKYAKTRRQQQLESNEKLQQIRQENQSSGPESEGESDREKTCQVIKHERQRSKATPANAAALRSKSWRPSLQSISEAGL
ncbi:hypothetical protein COLO4_37909 [Corchorus olitorius]|uniref:D-ribose-binding periplasmic protein n=1 Tax=Corchorus olitorius TaxID=93759 RepID=A0A1R3FY28_9ROSI|nr:hypothetical protein COLO4_37909 [Corchorus olitorius]